jgi:hypothetical protein
VARFLLKFSSTLKMEAQLILYSILYWSLARKLGFIKPVIGPQRKHPVANNGVWCGLLIGCSGRTAKKTRPTNLLLADSFPIVVGTDHNENTASNSSPIVAFLSGLQFQYIILITYNFDHSQAVPSTDTTVPLHHPPRRHIPVLIYRWCDYFSTPALCGLICRSRGRPDHNESVFSS